MKEDDLPEIDPAQLSAVCGGGTAADATTQMTQMMQQILTEIQGLAQTNLGGGNNSLMQILPLILLMRGRGASAAPPAPPPVYPETVVGPDGLVYTKAH
jgi:hypothetical protein